MLPMKNIYLKGILFILLIRTAAFAQIYSNTFTGPSACPTPGNIPTLAANASGTVVTRNTITCTAASNVFNSTNLNNTAAVKDNSYIEFSVTPDAGYQLNITSLSFFIQGSITAPNQLEVRYSTDGFATATSWGAAPNTVTSPGGTRVWDFADFSTTAGETVTFRFYPYGTQRSDLGTTNASATGTLRLDNIILNGTVIAPMPVKLSSFEGSYSPNTFLLKWQTAWEYQNEGFEIQYSTDAVNFKKAGFVKGHQTANTSSKYEFAYSGIMSGKTYYFRLKQLDTDGHFEYSRIISLSSETQNENFVFPNPNKGHFSLSSPGLTADNVKLFDKTGQEIGIRSVQHDGSNTLEVCAKNTIQPGLYYLSISGTEKTVKVLIEN